IYDLRAKRAPAINFSFLSHRVYSSFTWLSRTQPSSLAQRLYVGTSIQLVARQRLSSSSPSYISFNLGERNSGRYWDAAVFDAIPLPCFQVLVKRHKLKQN